MKATHALFALIAAAGLATSARAQELGPVVITEVMYDPHGTDEGQEWVEIYNPTSGAVDLSRWGLQNSRGRTSTLPDGTSLASHAVAVIAPRRGGVSGTTATRQSTFTVTQASWDAAWGPGIRVLFVESFWNYPGDPVPVTGTLEGLANPGDSIQLIDRNRNVVDQVVYATDAPTDTRWPDPNDGGSIQLLRDFSASITDNNNGAAWRLSEPGDALGSQLANTALPAFPGLASYGTPGRLPNQTFVDCNGNGINDPVEIVHGQAADSYPFNNIPDPCEGDCNGNGQPDLTEIALNWQLDRNANAVLDSCEINAHGGVNGVGGTLDTNFNGILDSFETKPNIVITEIMYDPNGDDAGKEYVEIYNAGATAVDLSGWALKDLEGDPRTGSIPAGTLMQPHEVIVLMAGSGPGVPTDILSQFRAAWSIPSGVRVFALNPWQDRAQRATYIEEVLALVDGAGEPVDVADYENPAFAPGSLWPADDTASSIYLLPSALSKSANDGGANWARSMAHIDGAYDSVQTAFITDIRGTGSAGSPGIVWTAPHQAPTGEAVITEIMYHPNSNPGDVSRAEWIEVYNPGTATLSLSGWYLRDEDGHTGTVGAGAALAGGQVMVLIPQVGAISASAAEANFRAAWGNVCSVVALTGWSDAEPIPNIGGLANNPAPGNEVLTLRRADGTVVDIVNFDDANGWPAGPANAGPGLGTAWSIYLLPGHYTATENDLGQNWAASTQGIDLAQLNTMTAVFNGFDIGSPGLLPGVVTSPACPPASCYANCDGSTAAPVLNVADFTCFLQRYASGDVYANCDGSTTAPVLNVADFSCFLTRYAVGCP